MVIQTMVTAAGHHPVRAVAKPCASQELPPLGGVLLEPKIGSDPAQAAAACYCFSTRNKKCRSNLLRLPHHAAALLTHGRRVAHQDQQFSGRVDEDREEEPELELRIGRLRHHTRAHARM